MSLFGNDNEDTQTEESTEDTTTWADGVRQALEDRERLARENLTATFGEPCIISQSTNFIENKRVGVPLRDVPYEATERLVFSMPGAGEDSDFPKLLDAYDLDLDSMEELKGMEVPVAFIAGNVYIGWRDMVTSNEEEIAEPDADEPDTESGIGQEILTPDDV